MGMPDGFGRMFRGTTLDGSCTDDNRNNQQEGEQEIYPHLVQNAHILSLSNSLRLVQSKLDHFLSFPRNEIIPHRPTIPKKTPTVTNAGTVPSLQGIVGILQTPVIVTGKSTAKTATVKTTT